MYKSRWRLSGYFGGIHGRGAQARVVQASRGAEEVLILYCPHDRAPLVDLNCSTLKPDRTRHPPGPGCLPHAPLELPRAKPEIARWLTRR